MSTENRRISSEIVKVIHNDGNEQVQHLNAEFKNENQHYFIDVKSYFLI